MDQTRVPGLRVAVLRGVEARRDGVLLEVPGPRLRSLLALLALTPGVPRRAEYLADQLWDGEPPSANALQALVSRLRRALGTDVVLSRPTGYLLSVGPEQVDLGHFDRLLSERTPVAAREALALAGPEPLAEFADVPDLADEARRVEAECLKARTLAEFAPPPTGPMTSATRPFTRIGRRPRSGRSGFGPPAYVGPVTQLLLPLAGGTGGTGKPSIAKVAANARNDAVIAEPARLVTKGVPAEVVVAAAVDDDSHHEPFERHLKRHVRRAGGVPNNGRHAHDRVRRMRKALRNHTSAGTRERGEGVTEEEG